MGICPVKTDAAQQLIFFRKEEAEKITPHRIPAAGKPLGI